MRYMETVLSSQSFCKSKTVVELSIKNTVSRDGVVMDFRALFGGWTCLVAWIEKQGLNDDS